MFIGLAAVMISYRPVYPWPPLQDANEIMRLHAPQAACIRAIHQLFNGSCIPCQK